MTGRAPIDISVPITERTPVYPGDPSPGFDTSIEDGVTLTVLHLPLHAGSHVDAPLHVLPGGTDADSVPLEALCGPCCVVEAGPGPIDENRVRGWPLRDRDRVLVRPGPSGCVFTPGGARALVERRVRLLGVGDFGPDAVGDSTLPAHRVLLSAGIVLIENLRLDDAPPGRWRLTCLGLRLPGREAFPVRAVLS